MSCGVNLSAEPAADEALPGLAVAVEDLERLLLLQLGMQRADVDVGLLHVGRQLDRGNGDEQALEIERLAHAGGEFLAQDLGHADGAAGGHALMSTKPRHGCNPVQGRSAHLARAAPELFLAPNGKVPLNGPCLMNKCFWRLVLVAGTAVILAGCGNKETKEALRQGDDAGEPEAIPGRQRCPGRGAAGARGEDSRRCRHARRSRPPIDALTKKVQADPEILKMERAQIPLYLHMERADMASAVYADILAGDPGDTVVYDTLHDKDPLIRTGAVRVLGLTGKPEAIDALAGATKDPTRMCAAPPSPRWARSRIRGRSRR